MTTQTLTGLETLLEGLGLKTPIPAFPEADVLNKPLDIGRSYLAEILSDLVDCDATNAYNSIQLPNDMASDLSTVLPKLSHGADPDDLAMELMQKFPQSPLFMLPIPGGVHLRIIFEARTLPRFLLPYINDRKDLYGRDATIGLHDPASPESGHKKVIVEFSSPNIASEFQGKHLRSTILGAHVAKIHESMGWDVIKVNYLGDWGKPLGLLGTAWEKNGSEELFESDPVGHLLHLYHQVNDDFQAEQVKSKAARDEGKDTAEIEGQGLFAERNAYFKRMEEGEKKAVAFAKRVRDVNVDSYTKLYARLNVNFDEYSGESQVSHDTISEVEEILKTKGLCEESGDSWIVDLNKHLKKKAGTAIIRDRSGSSTYLLRDLAAVLERSRKYSFDKMIYVVAADHNIHFSRVVNILKLMDMSELADKLQHLQFSASSQMSEKLDREHNFAEILDQCETAMKASLDAHPDKASVFGDVEPMTSVVGISALLAQEVAARRGADHAFDIGRMTSFEDGTGPDLQYWYAKLTSILRDQPLGTTLSDDDVVELAQGDQIDLLRLLVQYPDITFSTYKSLEPATIWSYLANMTAILARCFPENCTQLSSAQAILYEAAKIVLENGLKVLGITPVTN